MKTAATTTGGAEETDGSDEGLGRTIKFGSGDGDGRRRRRAAAMRG